MQNITPTMRAAIRSDHQAPLARIEIYNADGSLAGEITNVISCVVDCYKSRKVRRTFTAYIDDKNGQYAPDPFLFGQNFFWYNKTIKIFYGFLTEAGAEWLPQGEFTLDSIKPEVLPDGQILEISGQDFISKMIEDKFEDVFTVKDDLTTESGNYAAQSLGATASATSYMVETLPGNVIQNYVPTFAIDSDVYRTFWSPSNFDSNPSITIDMKSSRSINVIYTYWGKHAFDYDNRVRYRLETSTNGTTWSQVTDLNGITQNTSLFGDVEHVFNNRSARYIRITILSFQGQAMLRHIKVQNIQAVETVDKVIRDVATSAGITKFKLPQTRRWIKRKQMEIGEEKYTLIQDVATAIGWESPYMDEEGFLVTRPNYVDPFDVVWEFDTDKDNILSFSPRFTNSIYNVIVAIFKSSTEKAIVGRAIDDDPTSPTYAGPGGLGRRVYKYESDLINTQDKADQFAAQKLFERTRLKHQTSLPVTGHPGIQVGDVVTVKVLEAKINALKYVITGYESAFSAESVQFDTRINISEL